MRALVLVAVLTLAGCVPKDRISPHAVYLRDAAGDCVALYQTQVTRLAMRHVNTELCK